mmetsp:Transcript_68876/g.165333  ORF Transcript_68876/g.165333 Transcript_68876/m.165333 type:complete len:202 (+) Transcript_68876:862-1467(+)
MSTSYFSKKGFPSMPCTSRPICSASCACMVSITSQPKMSSKIAPLSTSSMFFRSTLLEGAAAALSQPPLNCASGGPPPSSSWPLGVTAFTGKPEASTKFIGVGLPSISSWMKSMPAPSAPMGMRRLRSGTTPKASTVSTAGAGLLAASGAGAGAAFSSSAWAGAGAGVLPTGVGMASTMGLPTQSPAMPWSKTQPRPSTFR